MQRNLSTTPTLLQIEAQRLAEQAALAASVALVLIKTMLNGNFAFLLQELQVFTTLYAHLLSTDEMQNGLRAFKAK